MTQQERAVIEAVIQEIEALDRALTIEQSFSAAIRRLLLTKGLATPEELETTIAATAARLAVEAALDQSPAMRLRERVERLLAELRP